jgi:N-acetyl-alpha-D-glucosaminyl L-malate synthase BshA
VRVGIVCYASVGGSGVVATELAHALALRSHQVTLMSSEVPFRWRAGLPGLSFQRVDTPAYPLFREPQYLLALANTIVRVACDRELDIVHAHYAVPHATAAYLADQILGLDTGNRGPRTVTTLHGTDITLVGSDPSYARVVAFSIEQSHGVTAVSESLKRETIDTLRIAHEIEVIPNFLDCASYRRLPQPALRARFAPNGESIVMHVSNFRPVKQVDAVLDVFIHLRRTVPVKLVMIGDGPQRHPLERRVLDEGLSGDVTFVREQQDLVPWLSVADLFLLPSSQESFGMAALEAMACEVPVVASRIGGLPEVIEDGVTGFLCALDDIDHMVARSEAILRDLELKRRIGKAASDHVRTKFCADVIVPRYEAYYKKVLGS